MKITEQTLKILKNFAGINPSILIRKGSMIATQSIAGNILAETQVEEEFPCEFALYDLVEFLNTLKLFNAPILDFNNANLNYMNICEEDDLSFKVRYTFGKKNHIIYPERRPLMESNDVMFDLDLPTLDSIMKAANVMQLPNMMILPGDESGTIKVEVSDVKDKSSNKFSIGIKGISPEDKDFILIFKMDTFKMLPNNYNITISGNKTASFESDLVDYYIGLDVNSRF
jgi:hypothetical protein